MLGLRIDALWRRGRILSGLAMVIVLAVVAFWSGCGKGQPFDLAAKPIEVQLVNRDGLPAHLFKWDENFPCCQVQSGSSRTVTITMNVDDTSRFTAGRNGDTFSSTTCRLTNAGYSGAIVLVVLQNGRLDCSGW